MDDIVLHSLDKRKEINKYVNTSVVWKGAFVWL